MIDVLMFSDVLILHLHFPECHGRRKNVSHASQDLYTETFVTKEGNKRNLNGNLFWNLQLFDYSI